MALLPDGPLDTLGYLDLVRALPEALETTLDAGPVEDLVSAADIDHVVVATAAPLVGVADLVAAIAAPESPLPVLPVGVGALPAAVGARTLVVAVGGDAAAVAAEAGARGAAVVRFVGEPTEVTRLGGVPLAVRVLLLLDQLGLVAGVADAANAAVTQLRRRGDQLLSEASPARTLARRIGRTLPIVYGTDELGGAAARAWKRQLNLSAKVAAFAGSLPEIATAEIAGWGQHGDMTRQVFSLVELRHDHEPAGTAARAERLEALVDEVVHDRHVITAEGDGRLAQLLDLVFQGDVLAFHLAQELEIDPGPAAAADG